MAGDCPWPRRHPGTRGGSVEALRQGGRFHEVAPHFGASPPMVKAARPAVVVVGTGMAGAKVVQEVLARAPDRFHIRMFGAEPHGTYNRILLSSVLGGYQDPNQLWLNPLEWYQDHGVFVHAGVKAERIDRDERV